MSHPDTQESAHPAGSLPATSLAAEAKAGAWFLVSALLLVAGSLGLGWRLGGGWGLLVGIGGIAISLPVGMLGLFALLSRGDGRPQRRRPGLTVLGAVVGGGGLGLGGYVGGLAGASLGLLGLGLGSLLLGLGLLASSEARKPSPAPPVTS